ncbi:MAG: hypothetical protein A2Y94_01665, partial [Caldithrix sp. RBG_13_44_9]
DEDSKYFDKAQSLVLKTSHDLYTTSKNLSEFLVVVTKYPKNSLSISESIKVIRDFSEFITILYPSPLSFKLFQELLMTYNPRGLKIHDIEIVSIALSHQIDLVATFNEQDFKDIKEITLYFK